ncbi:MAG: hypothetical protein ACJAVI_006052, partial [Candidatus Azotimanducaceae bacterium]
MWAHASEFIAFVEGVIPPPIDVEAIRACVENEAPEENKARLIEISRVVLPELLAPIEDAFHTMDPSVLEKQLNLVIDPAAQKIADYLRELIRDSDTIQVGIGQ